LKSTATSAILYRMGVSLISPFFLQAAADLLRRLEAVSAPEARTLGAEVREYTELFDGWLTHRPDDAVRLDAIRRFLDLNRRANEFLAQHPTPSSGRQARASEEKKGDE
jgi:hypothetical protein